MLQVGVEETNETVRRKHEMDSLIEKIKSNEIKTERQVNEDE